MTRVYTMTFQASNDPTFVTGVLTMTCFVRQGNDELALEGAEQVTFDGRKGRARTQRLTLEIVFDATDVVASDFDNGHYDSFMAMHALAHQRITATTLPRVTRTFAAGVIGTAVSYWNDNAIGLLKDGAGGARPFVYELASVSRGKPSEGKQSWSIEIYDPEIQ